MADELDRCGCCETDVREPRLHNGPGLPSLAYRVSTSAEFLRRMLSRLSREGIEGAPNVLRYPLSALGTRSPGDPAIALLDAWSLVGDVLTFYQERLANEGYLRTATERRSILELAALIGYQLNPGVAANVHLAFQVDDAVGAPGVASVPKGMRVQSVPVPGALPQPFETGEEITARVEWNTLRPRQMRPQELAIRDGKLMMLGLSVGLHPEAEDVDVSEIHPLDLDLPLPPFGAIKAAEVATVYLAGTNLSIKTGDVLLFVGKQTSADAKEHPLPKVVRAVQVEDALDRTRIDLEGPQVKPLGYGTKLNQFAAVSLRPMGLNSLSANAVAQATFSEQALGAFAAAQGWGMTSLVSYYYHAFTLAAPKLKLPPAAPGAFAMRARAGFFGHNAPALVAGTGTTGMQSQDLSTTNIWRTGDADCYLERTVSGISDNSWLILDLKKQLAAFRVTTAHEASLAQFGLSGKATGLVLDSGTVKDDKYRVRDTTAHVQSERIALAQLPIEAPIGKGTAEDLQLTLDRTVLNLRVGQFVALTGERADLTGVTASEIVTLKEIQHSGGFTTLFFESPGLKRQYVRDTVVLNANVAPATHGETVFEVLGSGDGAAGHQQFTLKRPPLTYTTSSSETGVQSSLQVRVNQVLWTLSDQFIDQGPSSERYIVRIADDGKASVVFGDGRHGARLPSGIENVTASYRSGTGAAGMVGADRITLMTARPLGIRGVTNPLAASGAADPESRDSARANAPLTVLAMGRVVSLRDAEDFAQAFAGIGKAQARAVWHAGIYWVHLTVAASVPAPTDDSGAALPDYRLDVGSSLGKNLAAAIDTFKEPTLNLRLDTYQPIYFDVSAKVSVDPRYEWETVETALRAALTTAFSFDRRGFAQSVSLAEVIGVLHSVAGVVFVDVDVLRRFDQPTPELPDGGVLRAEGVRWEDSEGEPGALAQLLIVNPFGIALTRI
jgi:predicted phage baseplate assembly protein